ncbi:MAG: hypothetical protein ACYDC1_11980 [Limisphaerales bacterium]
MNYLALLQLIQLAGATAVTAAQAFATVKPLLATAFKKGEITTEEQAQLAALIAAHTANAKAGLTNPAWTVEADPE